MNMWHMKSEPYFWEFLCSLATLRDLRTHQIWIHIINPYGLHNHNQCSQVSIIFFWAEAVNPPPKNQKKQTAPRKTFHGWTSPFCLAFVPQLFTSFHRKIPTGTGCSQDRRSRGWRSCGRWKVADGGLWCTVGRGPEGREAGEQLNMAKEGPWKKHEVRDGSGEGLQQVESILFHNIPMCHMLRFNNPCRRPKKSLCQLCSCYCISCRRNYACEHFFPRNMTLTSLERVFSGCLSRSHWRWQNALCKIGGTRRIRDFRPLINHGPSPSCTSLPSMAIHTGCSIKK